MWNERFKLSFVLVLLSIVILSIFVRLIYLQIYKHKDYLNYAENQSLRKVQLLKNRGLIYDRRGAVLAENKKAASLYVYGRDIKDPYRIKLILKDYNLNMNSRNYNYLRKREGFIWLIRNIKVDKARKISGRYPYIHYILQENRYYPKGENVAKIVGFTGVDNQGLQGVEYALDKKLKGEKTNVIYLRDSRNRPILLKDKEYISESSKGVYLTIDSEIQETAGIILKKDMKRFGAKKAIAAGINVNTGEIIFSVSYPSYDPDSFEKYSKSTWKSMLTNYLFEPGSIFKAITFGFLLENENLNLNKQVDCENGRYTVYGHTYNDVHDYDKLKASEVIINSSNIGTVKLISEASGKKFHKFLSKVGFGESSDVLGVSEEKGLLRDYDKWSGLSKPSISIGQEIYVTPLQILQYYAAVANDGVLVSPHLIKKAVKGEEVFKPDIKSKKWLSENSAKTLQMLLKKVVDNGTGVNASSDYVDIGGKTGTAQKFLIDKGRYSYKNYVASFVGFFPATSPEVAMIVIYDSPSVSIYGGSTAAYTFESIAEQIMLNKGYKIQRLRVSSETKKAS